MKEKHVLADASTLISLTSSCLLHSLKFFHEKFGVRFFIPQSVEYEAVTRPLSLKVKIHRFSALRIKKMINEDLIHVVEDNLEKETRELMKLGNSVFYARGKPLNLFHKGEVEMLALARKLDMGSLLMDERTTRILIEEPDALRMHLQHEFKTNILINRNNLSKFLSGLSHMEVVRSTELIYLAYKNGFFSNYDELEAEAAEAALYKLKYSGCAISFKELEEYGKLIK